MRYILIIPEEKIDIMDEIKAKKIGAMLFIVLGIIIFFSYSVHLILFKLSLPPWSIQTEGKYVAYGLEVWGFLFFIPVIFSLFLLSYLIYPLKIKSFSTVIGAIFIILTIGGFGITALLITSAIINNFPPVNYIPFFIFSSIAGTSPFWIMGISAVFAFKKDKFENMKKEYKMAIVMILAVVTVVTVWLMIFSFLTHW